MRADAGITRWLLAPTEQSRLAMRVRELAESRADVVDVQAAELRRIERDLHDGAQARLVSLGMNLGMAEEIVESDPAAARNLLSEARATTETALRSCGTWCAGSIHRCSPTAGSTVRCRRSRWASRCR